MRRVLPKGWGDLARQVALFVGAYYAYMVVRGLADQPGAAAEAFANAREIIGLQQALGVFVEPSVQAWASGSQLLLDAASWIYINAQTSVTLGVLVFLYLFRNESFYFVRNMFLIGLGITKRGNLDLVGLVDFILGTVTDEHGLTTPLDDDLSIQVR